MRYIQSDEQEAVRCKTVTLGVFVSVRYLTYDYDKPKPPFLHKKFVKTAQRKRSVIVLFCSNVTHNIRVVKLFNVPSFITCTRSFSQT